MKKTTLFTLTLLFSFGFLLKQGLAQDPASRGEAVSIPDPNLRFYIALELGKAEAASITVAEMETLTEFSADDRSVKDLTGIEFATNLTHLFLGGNQISDISLLAHLTNLTWLDLDDNQISDVSPLVGLSNLTHLSLSSNQISDVSPLTNLINLKTLYVDDNQISDVSPLAKLTNLKKLFLDINQISDVSPLAKLTNLTELGLSSNQISDVSPLAKLTNLTVLNLQSNQISDFSPTDRLKPNLVIYIKNLQQVNGKVVESEQPDVEIDDVIDDGLPPDHIDPSHLDEAHPEDAGGDFTLEGLMTTAHIPDPNLLSAIEEALGKADIERGGSITVAEMETLKDLRANKQGIQDLTGLEFATNLTQARLSNNQISDISVLAELTKLTELYLAGNQISDVSPLAGLTKLTKLILSSNQISDFSSTDRLKPNLVTYKKDLQRVGGPDDVIDDGLPPDHIDPSHLDEAHPEDAGGDFTLDAIFPVHIPDSNLRTAIEKGLGKISGATISYADIRKLTDLRANKQGIQDLTGLEFATNLTQARLSNNQISDISVLAELTKLTELYLAGNQISDVSPLAGLTKLTKLILSSNQISDFSSTDRLKPNLVTYKKDLQRVGGPDDVIDDGLPPDHIIPDPNLRTAIEEALGKSPGATITRMDMLKLTALGPTNVGIQDLTELEFAKNLTWLSLGGNSISDVSALVALTNLTTLDLRQNNISDVSALASLTNLTFLGLLDNGISDVSALAALANLTTLDLGDNSISDVSALAALTNLTTLDLGGNSISDVSALAALANLTTLDLGDNSISDVSALAALTNLTTLDLGGNSISDVSALAALANLTTLDLARNNISNFSPIAGLVSNLHRYDNRNQEGANEPVHIPDPYLRAAIENKLGKAPGTTITRVDMLKLRSLSVIQGIHKGGDLTGTGLIDNKGIQYLTGLEFAKNLRVLFVPHNQISDVSVLSGLTNLTDLELTNNQISDVSPLRGLTNLSTLRLALNFISDFSPIAGLIPNLVRYTDRDQAHLLAGGDWVRKNKNAYGATVYRRSGDNETCLIEGLELQGVNDSKVYADYTQFLPPENGKHFEIYTQKGSTCGQYSALMLLNYYGVNVSKKTFDDVADISHTLWGTTPHELIKGLGALLPVEIEHYKVAYPAYASLINKVSESRPPIIVIRLSEIGYHHVVVVGYDTKTHKFLIADPNGFFYWNDWEEWSNTGRISKSGKEIWRPPLRDSWRLDYQEEDLENAWDVWLIPDMQWTSRVPWLGDTFSSFRMFVPKIGPPYHNLASKTFEIYVTGDVQWDPLEWTWHDWEEERIFNGKVLYVTQYSERRNSDVRDIRIEGNKVIVSGRISNGIPLDANILLVDNVFYGAVDMVLTAYYDPSVRAAPSVVLPPLAKRTVLLPNYPNPFNPETWIPYHLSEPAEVTLTIYGIDGRVVRRLDLGHQDAGYYQSKARAAYWDGRNAVGERVASGIYFYTLTVGDFAATKKLLIRK